MARLKTAPATPAPRPALPGIGGTDRALARLADATHRLSVRRARDLLPGKIATRRLVLRAPMRGDVPDLVRLADNKTIAERLANLPSPYTRADATAFIEIFAQRADQRPYAITLNDRLIGVIGFSFIEGKPPELGYWLGEPHWGQGFTTEAARALIDVAQATHQYETIAARALADNAGSLRVLEKLGFTQLKPKSRSASRRSADKPMLSFELRRPRWM
jgi:RimJ/RimL family protein N-acetyltransferase